MEFGTVKFGKGMDEARLLGFRQNVGNLKYELRAKF
jgi:hypothetical protein